MLRILLHIPVVTAAAALFLLMVMTFSDVMLRSMANAPIEQATELTRIFMAIIVFSVMPIVSTNGEHIAVDLTDGLFDRVGLTRLRDGFLFLICGTLLFWPMQRVWILAERARDFGDITEYLSIPQFLVGWFIAGSLAITMIAMICVGLAILARGAKS